MGLLHTAGGRRALASRLGGELFAGRFAAGRFAGSLFRTCHFRVTRSRERESVCGAVRACRLVESQTVIKRAPSGAPLFISTEAGGTAAPSRERTTDGLAVGGETATHRLSVCLRFDLIYLFI